MSRISMTAIVGFTSILFMIVGNSASAAVDPVQAKIDDAKSTRAMAKAAARSKLLTAFDEQIKLEVAAKDLETVKTLSGQKDAFVANGVIPASPLMKDALARYDEAVHRADIDLIAEYDSAIAEYTKASKVTEVMEVRRQRRLVVEGHEETAAVTGPQTPEATAGALDKAKSDYLVAIDGARKALLSAIDARIDSATQSGDLKAVTSLRQVRVTTEAGGTIPSDTSDTALIAARNRYEQVVRSNNVRLALAYKGAVREFTRAQHLDEATAAQAELEHIGLAAVGTGDTAPASSGNGPNNDTGVHRLAKILPAYLTASTLDAEKDGIRLNKSAVHSKTGNFLTQDFVFDVTVDVQAKSPWAYVGLSEATAHGEDRYKHWVGVCLRSIDDKSGLVTFNRDDPYGSDLGHNHEPGAYMVRIEKRGNTVTYSVGPEKPGQPFTPEISKTIADIRTFEKDFNDRNVHLMFSGGALFKNVRLAIGSAAAEANSSPGDTTVPATPVNLSSAGRVQAAPAVNSVTTTVPPKVMTPVVPAPPVAPAPPAVTVPPVVGTASIFDAPAAGPAYKFTVVPPQSSVPAKRTFASDEKLSTDLAFTAADGPYELKDNTKIGWDKSGKKEVKITAGPGAEIRGGEFHTEGATHINFEGDAAHPVIFRNVVFAGYMDSSFKAKYVIFDHCEFKKIGNYFRNNGLSTKWTFDKCLLSDCKFGGFSWVDYGIHFTETTFLGMKLHELGGNTGKDKQRDHMSYLRTYWRTFDECAFENCTVPQSIFWCAESSNFIKCVFASGIPFESDTPTTVVAYVEQTQGDKPDKFQAENPPKRAKLTIRYAEQPFPVFSFSK